MTFALSDFGNNFGCDENDRKKVVQISVALCRVDE